VLIAGFAIGLGAGEDDISAVECICVIECGY
jgi:hypothetical protein